MHRIPPTIKTESIIHVNSNEIGKAYSRGMWFVERDSYVWRFTAGCRKMKPCGVSSPDRRRARGLVVAWVMTLGAWLLGGRWRRWAENPATDERRDLRELVANTLCTDCLDNRVAVQRLDIKSELGVRGWCCWNKASVLGWMHDVIPKSH